MRAAGRAVLMLAAALLATGCVEKRVKPVAYETEAWSFGSSPGYKMTTEHYQIYTTLQDSMLVEALPQFVEAAYANYTKLLPPQKPLEKRMDVLLFVRRGEWERFTRRLAGPRRASLLLKVRYGGYSERGVSVIEYVRHDVTFPLFAHEGFHQYLYHQVNAQVPAWLNEGLAVCAEGQRWGSHGVQEFDPWFNPKRRNQLVEALQKDRLHPLSRLLSTNAGEVIQETSTAVSTYYAQLWALILFLREGAGGKYAAGFQRLLDTLHDVDLEQYAKASHIWSDRPFNFGEDVFRNFISDDLDTVETEYVAFMREKFLGKP